MIVEYIEQPIQKVKAIELKQKRTALQPWSASPGFAPELPVDHGEKNRAKEVKIGEETGEETGATVALRQRYNDEYSGTIRLPLPADAVADAADAADAVDAPAGEWRWEGEPGQSSQVWVPADETAQSVTVTVTGEWLRKEVSSALDCPGSPAPEPSAIHITHGGKSVGLKDTVQIGESTHLDEATQLVAILPPISDWTAAEEPVEIYRRKFQYINRRWANGDRRDGRDNMPGTRGIISEFIRSGRIDGPIKYIYFYSDTESLIHVKSQGPTPYRRPWVYGMFYHKELEHFVSEAEFMKFSPPDGHSEKMWWDRPQWPKELSYHDKQLRDNWICRVTVCIFDPEEDEDKFSSDLFLDRRAGWDSSVARRTAGTPDGKVVRQSQGWLSSSTELDLLYNRRFGAGAQYIFFEVELEETSRSPFEAILPRDKKEEAIAEVNKKVQEFIEALESWPTEEVE